jgi:hypothetical protein
LSSWLRIARDPRGGDIVGLMTRLAERDFTDFPGLNKYRSEIRGNFQLLSWNETYWYHWRFVVPPDWFNLGAGSEIIVGQMHEVNGGNVGRRPTFAWEITENRLHAVFSYDSIPGGVSVWSTEVKPGMEFDLAVRVRWADGTNAPDSQGSVEVYNGSQLVYNEVGRNTWAGTPITEPNPPYIKCGVYQPGPAFPWWAGRASEIFHIACQVWPGDTPPAVFRRAVEDALVLNSGRPIGILER